MSNSIEQSSELKKGIPICPIIEYSHRELSVTRRSDTPLGDIV